MCSESCVVQIIHIALALCVVKESISLRAGKRNSGSQFAGDGTRDRPLCLNKTIVAEADFKAGFRCEAGATGGDVDGTCRGVLSE